MEKVNEWIDLAKSAGFETTAPLNMDALKFMPEVREMCSADRCNQYGRSWACPPACGTIDECSAKASEYTKGILVQSVGEIEDSFDIEGIQEIVELHRDRFIALTKTLREKDPDVLPLSAGGCNVCAQCTYPDEPCRFPDVAIPSMEAYGLLVNDVCKRSGVDYNYGSGKMAFTSCYLMK